MPDALDLLRTRRSFKPLELIAPVPDAAQIETILTIASRVPDHGKLAPWRFVIFEGEACVRAGQALATLVKQDDSVAGEARIDAELTRFTRAPLSIMVVSRAAPHVKIPEWEQLLSAGAACMNLLMAVHALGFAGNWVTEWVAYDARARAVLGLADHERIAGIIQIGTPTKPPEDRPRPALADIVTRF